MKTDRDERNDDSFCCELAFTGRSIGDIKCSCPCGWTGSVADAMPDIDGDGSLGCPVCKAPVRSEIDEPRGDRSAKFWRAAADAYQRLGSDCGLLALTGLTIAAGLMMLLARLGMIVLAIAG